MTQRPSLSAHLSEGRLLVQSQAAGEQPGRLLLEPDRYPVQPGGLSAGVRGGPERAADLALSAQEKHGAAGTPPAAQGKAQPGPGGSRRPSQRARGPRRGGLRLQGRAGGRRGAGAGDRGGGWRRRAQRVPRGPACAERPRPMERALVHSGQPSEQRHHGVTPGVVWLS